MCMQIQDHLHVVLFFFNVVFNRMDDLIMKFMRSMPFAIRIGPNKLSSWIPVYNSIDIYHWDNFKYKVIQ